jgi:G3E family GTPase
MEHATRVYASRLRARAFRVEASEKRRPCVVTLSEVSWLSYAVPGIHCFSIMLKQSLLEHARHRRTHHRKTMPADPDLLPCTVLTGFLGSGKTTLLNHLLTRERTRRIGCLINEFGAIDIDSSLLVAERAIDSGVVELSNGCICCTINDSLRDAVAQMLTRRQDIDHLVIETTGIADPIPVLTTLQLAQFSSALCVDAVVTVVDAGRVARAVGGLPDASPTPVGSGKLVEDAPASEAPASDGGLHCFRQQLDAANLLVINKTDLVPTAALELVCTQLARETPRARQIRCQHGRVAPELLLCALADGSAGEPEETRSALASHGGARYGENYPAGSAVAPAWAAGKRRPHLEVDGFRSIGFTSPRPLQLAHFERLRQSRAWDSVVRAKGFLTFAECSGYAVTYQQAGNRVDVRCKRDPDAEGCTLVLIGQALDETTLLRALGECAVPGPGGGDELLCPPCDEVEATGLAPEGTKIAAAAAAFAARVQSDTRFDEPVMQLDNAVVAFRMLAWFGVSAEELNAQLLDEVNTGTASGASWLAPSRRECDGRLELLQALSSDDDAGRRWQVIYQATEKVMMGHFGSFFCGGCDCTPADLAGQVLT